MYIFGVSNSRNSPWEMAGNFNSLMANSLLTWDLGNGEYGGKMDIELLSFGHGLGHYQPVV